ncbi:MAG: hypothetical protein LBH79_03165 [Nitrososphaerota archaeon]|jgi:hypothetical protein|nr:hypothetical protein [Nitrososphaerota archaeon]
MTTPPEPTQLLYICLKCRNPINLENSYLEQRTRYNPDIRIEQTKIFRICPLCHKSTIIAVTQTKETKQ